MAEEPSLVQAAKVLVTNPLPIKVCDDAVTDHEKTRIQLASSAVEGNTISVVDVTGMACFQNVEFAASDSEAPGGGNTNQVLDDKATDLTKDTDDNVEPVSANTGFLQRVASETNGTFVPDYTTDEFRMFLFKIRQCPHQGLHDWTACPWLHPKENSRRRDPKVFRYLPNLCRHWTGNKYCKRGDSCHFSHGLYEAYLHPAKYRTELCRDGENCKRQHCFFAHSEKELRQPELSYNPTEEELERSANSVAAASNRACGSPVSGGRYSPMPPAGPVAPAHFAPLRRSASAPLAQAYLGYPFIQYVPAGPPMGHPSQHMGPVFFPCMSPISYMQPPPPPPGMIPGTRAAPPLSTKNPFKPGFSRSASIPTAPSFTDDTLSVSGYSRLFSGHSRSYSDVSNISGLSERSERGMDYRCLGKPQSHVRQAAPEVGCSPEGGVTQGGRVPVRNSPTQRDGDSHTTAESVASTEDNATSPVSGGKPAQPIDDTAVSSPPTAKSDGKRNPAEEFVFYVKHNDGKLYMIDGKPATSVDHVIEKMTERYGSLSLQDGVKLQFDEKALNGKNSLGECGVTAGAILQAVCSGMP